MLLRHYDTNKNTFIFVDAHFTGLFTILAQGQSIEQTKAVALASRTTTAAEKNYSQLDLEATAIDFGHRQFHHILTGGPQITVVTDQQPLQSLWRDHLLELKESAFVTKTSTTVSYGKKGKKIRRIS